MNEEKETLQEEVLKELENVKKKIEEIIEEIKEYGIGDLEVIDKLYFFARENLLRLIERIFRATTCNSKFEALFTVLREVILPADSEYDLEDFKVIIVLHNYKKMINIYMENIFGNTEFYILEKDYDEKRFDEIYRRVKKVFENARGITN